MSGTSSGIYTRLVSGLVFPIHERLKRHSTVAVRRAMEQSQWWPADRLRDFQLSRLRGFLTEIQACVPFYRQGFASIGFDPRGITSIDDLQRLPFLTKALIRDNVDALKHTSATDLSRFNTGGSSGEPLVFYIGRERVSHDVAAKWRATRWWGVDIGDRELVVWGSPIELGAQDRVRQVRDRVMRTALMPAFEMNARTLDGMVKRIRDERPRMLFGYPSALSRIAQHARQAGVPLDTLGIRVAFVTSERLYDEQRDLIASTFGCPVANGYGGRDAGFIAHQCPAGGMHITAEDIIVETIDEGGRPTPPGVAGEIVVTHLATRHFPFVRYRTGDVGILDDRPCSCGRGLPLLREIQGRSTDFIVAADGTVMHGLALIYIVRDLPQVSAFKIVQESLALTSVQLVCPGGALDATVREGIVHGFKRRLGESVQVKIDLVDHIAAERSGKYRYVVSHVQPGEARVPA